MKVTTQYPGDPDSNPVEADQVYLELEDGSIIKIISEYVGSGRIELRTEAAQGGKRLAVPHISPVGSSSVDITVVPWK